LKKSAKKQFFILLYSTHISLGQKIIPLPKNKTFEV
jgi:hypothetical protein